MKIDIHSMKFCLPAVVVAPCSADGNAPSQGRSGIAIHATSIIRRCFAKCHNGENNIFFDAQTEARAQAAKI